MVQFEVNSKDASPVPANARQVSGFATLDACHRSVLARVAELGALVALIEAGEITPATPAPDSVMASA